MKFEYRIEFSRREINDNNYLKSIRYDLNDYRDQHYDPPEFFNYLKEFSNKNPNIKYIIFYKYEFFNHFMDNEYHNKIMMINGEITDDYMKS